MNKYQYINDYTWKAKSFLHRHREFYCGAYTKIFKKWRWTSLLELVLPCLIPALKKIKQNKWIICFRLSALDLLLGTPGTPSFQFLPVPILRISTFKYQYIPRYANLSFHEQSKGVDFRSMLGNGCVFGGEKEMNSPLPAERKLSQRQVNKGGNFVHKWSFERNSPLPPRVRLRKQGQLEARLWRRDSRRKLCARPARNMLKCAPVQEEEWQTEDEGEDRAIPPLPLLVLFSSAADHTTSNSPRRLRDWHFGFRVPFTDKFADKSAVRLE